MQKTWNELKHVLVHVIYFKRDWLKRNFGQPRHLHYFVCWSSDAPPPLVQQMFKFLASSIVQVSMSSSTRCDTVSVCLLSWSDTHITEVLAGVSLSVNAFECWHARGPSRLARLVKDLTCAAASQAYVERIFSACGLLYSGRRRAMFRCLEMSVCIKLKTVLEETSCPR